MSYCVLVALLVSMAASSYGVRVGEQCDTSADCIATITQSKCEQIFPSASCTKRHCTCNTGYTGDICTVIKLYGQSCTQNSECESDLTCTSSGCACASSTDTYRSEIAMCVYKTKKLYGESCTEPWECYNGRRGTSMYAMQCSTTCQCVTGYVHRSGFCYIPHVGEVCTASTGCKAMVLPLPNDRSRINETCTSGTCSCPSNANQYTTSYDGTSYSYCLATTTAKLQQDGTRCTLHNECASKICAACPYDATRIKRCLRINTSGVSGIQATTSVLLTLVALKVTLI